MKTTLIALFLLFSGIASATRLEPRHMNMIQSAITEKCGMMYDLTHVRTEQEILYNDNGNMIIGFTTTLKGLQPYDQNISDRFLITVISTYADGYDHNARDWGLYSIDSVNCQLQ